MVEEASKINIDEVRSKLDDVNKLIKPYQLAYVSPTKDCIFLEQNAHFMQKGMLDRLVSNVAEDGFLSQLPFGMKRDDGKYLILSGNHRLKASIKAKLEYILILYVDEIPKDKQIAYQLSHNALVGKDDIKMLKDIYEQIQTLENREYTGINGAEFIDIDGIKVNQISDADIELTEIKFLFVESRAKEVEKVIEVLEKSKVDDSTKLVVGSFDEFILTMTRVKEVFGVKSNTVAFGKMIDICNGYCDDVAQKEE